MCLGLHSAVSPFFPFHFRCSAIGFRRVFRQSAQKAQRHEKSISIDLFFSFCSLPRSKSFFSNSCKISATPILLLTLISVAPSPSDKRRDDSSAHAHTHTRISISFGRRRGFCEISFVQFGAPSVCAFSASADICFCTLATRNIEILFVWR